VATRVVPIAPPQRPVGSHAHDLLDNATIESHAANASSAHGSSTSSQRGKMRGSAALDVPTAKRRDIRTHEEARSSNQSSPKADALHKMAQHMVANNPRTKEPPKAVVADQANFQLSTAAACSGVDAIGDMTWLSKSSDQPMDEPDSDAQAPSADHGRIPLSTNLPDEHEAADAVSRVGSAKALGGRTIASETGDHTMTQQESHAHDLLTTRAPKALSGGVSMGNPKGVDSYSPFWLYEAVYLNAALSRVNAVDIGKLIELTAHLQVDKKNMGTTEVFKILACQYAAAPQSVNSRQPLVLRGYDAGQRQHLHKWVSRWVKNLQTKSVDDPLAPCFPEEERRSITLRRKENSQPIGDSEELEQHRTIHPAKCNTVWSTTGWTFAPNE